MNSTQFAGKLSSKDYLRIAFYSLLKEKPIYKITVKELCETAMVNRSTFYVNYTWLGDFFDQTMSELASGLVVAVESEEDLQKILHDKDAACRRYQKWYRHIYEHAEEFQLLLGVNGTIEFRNLLLKQGLDWYTRLINSVKPNYRDELSTELLAYYIVNAHLGLVQYYLSSGMKFSVEHMAEQMVSITMAGPYSILGQHLK